jgi:hypothetical protein
MIRKLILYCAALTLLVAPLAEAKSNTHTPGKPSKYKPSHRSKRVKPKSYKIRHGRIKH